ncbi:hypothetical protein JYU18_00155 [bacterium AH-315-E07]|nr:hypothetical protein [bacterium AH-315-E07]
MTSQCDLQFIDNLDYFNFSELPTGTTFSRVKVEGFVWLDGRDAEGEM